MGRDAELARIRSLVDGARGHRAAALLVAGEAGVGKTSLVEEALAGADVVWLAGFEAERDLPYAALTQLVSPMLSHLPALADPQRAALEVVLGHREGRDPGRLVLSMAVLSLVAAAAEDRPMVIAVDDVQWLDPPSRDAVLFVARRMVAERVALVLTLREGSLGLDVVGGLPRLDLTGLPAGDAEKLLPELSPRVVHVLVDRTGGNPLALVEIAQGLDEAQAAGVRPLPRELRHTRPEQAYAARLADLPAAARQAARVTALAGDAPREVLHAALDRLGFDLARLAPIEDLGMVVVTDKVTWRHPLARNAATHGPAADLVACHSALAAAWAAVQPDNPARAWHLAESVSGPDPEASDALAAAADLAAGRGAWADAADAWERSARLQPDDGRRANLLASAGQAAGRAGACTRAAILLDEALSLMPAPPLDLLLERANVDLALGRRASAQTTLRRVLEGRGDPGARIRAGAELVLGIDWEEVPAVGAHVLDVVEGLRDPADAGHEFLRLFCRAVLAYAERRYDESRRTAELAHRHLAEHRTLDSDPSLLHLAHELDAFAGVRAEVRPYEAAALARARLHGDLLELVPALMFAAQSGTMAGGPPPIGDWQEVELLARMAGMPFPYAFAACGLAEADALAGRADACRVRMEEVKQWRRRDPPGWMNLADPWLEAYMHLADRDPASAISVLRPQMPTLSHHAAHNLPVYIALVADTESLAAARAELEALAHLDHTPYFPLAELVAGDNLDAAAAGIDDYARFGGPPWDLGFLHWCLAHRYLAARKKPEARERLTSALERFHVQGATPWIERTEAELAALGAPVQRRHDGADLTDGEQRVARLVAQGHTNKEVAGLLFLSPKTVEFHLSSAYRKLGVTNRTALARRLSADLPKA